MIGKEIEPILWNPLNNPELGLMNVFSESLASLERKHPRLLPDLRQSSTILIGSDYGGQHRFAQYESLSFLFADLENCGLWETQRSQLRQRFLPDGRRLSYKNLGDSRRRATLWPFLRAADSIPGLVVTLLIDKRIESLFSKAGKLDTNTPELCEYAHWDRAVLEKSLRVIHMCGFFLAGLSCPYQDVLWFTDEDAIVANEARLREFVDMFSRVSSHYLPHTLRHVRIGTTRSDTGRRDIEDLVAVTDLVAGALCRVLTEYQEQGTFPLPEVVMPLPQSVPPKATRLVAWFSDQTQSLKKLAYVIRQDTNAESLLLSYLRFHDFQNQLGWPPH